ncbi:MAG: alginate export family protein [Myxococcota bacterium]|nr:alginate export family protein [Myxococcota bacterium]
MAAVGVLFGILGGATSSSAKAASARVVDVRVDPHPHFTRIEFELEGAARYRVEHRTPGGPGAPAEIVVHLGARGAYPMLTAVAGMRLEGARGDGLVQDVQLEGGRGEERGVARIRLATTRPQVRHTVLRNPTRIAVDVRQAPRRVERAAVAPPRRIEEPPAQRRKRRKLTEEPEEVRPREPLAIPLFGRDLVLSGGYEVRATFDGDPRLGLRDDDRGRLAQKLEIELFYPVTENVSLFADSEYAFDWDFFREGGGGTTEGVWERGETWLHVARLAGTPLGFQVGRQKLRDEREWWWDESLDSVRLFWSGDRVEAQLLLGQELASEVLPGERVEPEHEDVTRLLASADWRWASDQRLALFFLGQRDRSAVERLGRRVSEEREDELDADLSWLGLRATGGLELGRAGRLAYWGEGGFVWGRERAADFDDAPEGGLVVDEVVERDVQGWALDVGVTWRTPLPGDPSLSLGYAVGSGDRRPDDGREQGFRQTGLHDNEWDFGGRSRVRYYGELFDPELSNLHVATLGVEWPLFDASGLAFLLHAYRQVHAAPFLRDAGIRARPSGEDPDLGQELDAVLTLREWEPVRLEALAAVFRAGRAYGDEAGRLAYGAGLKFQVGF